MNHESTKVTVPKEVAEAIEDITSTPLGHAYNINTIMLNAKNSPESSYGTIWRWITRKDNADGVPEYFAALVNGYQVEQTPEEKLREYYESLDLRSREADEANGIIETLDILGITIEGINA